MSDELTGWGLPDEEYMACIDGLPENHFYRDMRWMDWSDYKSICRDSDELIELHQEHRDGYDLHELVGDNMAYYLDLDPEVAPVVAALAASGAVPFTSCSGNEGHFEGHPLVAFWALRDLEPRLRRAAEQADVHLDDTGQHSLIVWHLFVEPLRAFADALWKQHVD